MAAILELDEQLNKDFTIFEAAPQVFIFHFPFSLVFVIAGILC